MLKEYSQKQTKCHVPLSVTVLGVFRFRIFVAPYFVEGAVFDIRFSLLAAYFSRVRISAFDLEKTHDFQFCEGPAGGVVF